EPDVGVQLGARRRDGPRGRAPRRSRRHRDLAPALLLVDGRVGTPLRLPGVPPCGRPALGDATGRADRALGGRDPRSRGRADARPLRRALAGGQVLHWPAGDALLSGDIVQVIPDRAWVSFMYRYP